MQKLHIYIFYNMQNLRICVFCYMQKCIFPLCIMRGNARRIHLSQSAPQPKIANLPSLVLLPVLAGCDAREFFERAREVALRGKAEIRGNCGEGFICVPKKAFRLFCFLFLYSFFCCFVLVFFLFLLFFLYHCH